MIGHHQSKGIIMRTHLSYAGLAAFLTLPNLVIAEGSLMVENNLPDIEVRITTDLLCGERFVPEYNIRYTTPLKENPIPFQGKVKASWENCQILTSDYFERNKLPDHSKIYLTLLDTKTGDQFMATINTRALNYSREIQFSNHDIFLNMTYSTCRWGATDVSLWLNPA